MAGSNFNVGQLLKATDLNAALNKKLDLASTGNQNMIGGLTAPNLTAIIGLQTQDLTVTGNTLFATPFGIVLPMGSTLQRSGQIGEFRINTDSGLPEVRLPSGNYFNLQTVTAAQSPAIAPTALAAVQFGQSSSTSIPISWGLPTGGTAPFIYQVEYRLSGTSTWINWLAGIVAQKTTISGLLPGARYEFKVVVSNIAGSVASPAAATATLGYMPGGPVNLTATIPTSTSMFLNWNPVDSTSPVTYVVQYTEANSPVWNLYGQDIDVPYVTILGLNANTRYIFQVIAKTAGGLAYDSDVVTGTTTPNATLAPGVVQAITFSGITNNSFNLQWTQPTGTMPMVYNLQYQFGGQTSWNNIPEQGDQTASAFGLNQLTSGSTFSFRVQAINSAGTSTSQPFPVTLLSSAPVPGSVYNIQLSGPAYPVITGPQSGSVNYGSSLDISGVFVNDPAAAYLSGSMLLTVSCGTGTVTMHDGQGNAITGSGTSRISSYATTYGSLNKALATLNYTAVASSSTVNSSDSITIQVVDQKIQTSTLHVSVIVTPVVVVSPSPTPSPPPTPAPAPGGGGLMYTTTGQPSDSTGTVAVRAVDFTANTGVGTSFSSGNYGSDFGPSTAAVAENMIAYLNGISFIKDTSNFDALREGPFLQQIVQNSGLDGVILEIPSGSSLAGTGTSIWTNTLTQIAQFSNNYPGYLLGIQGVNAQSFTQNGVVTDSFDFNQAVSFQTQFVYPYAVSLGVPAIQQEFGVWSPPSFGTATYGLLDLFPDSVPSGGAFTTSAGGYLADSSAYANAAAPGKPVFVQFGYSSFPDNTPSHQTGSNFVDETTQAKYLLQSLMDINIGSQMVTPAAFACWYNLCDTPNSTLGLFSSFGGAPKKSAQALRSLLTVLKDYGSQSSAFQTGYLNYTVTGKPTQYQGFVDTGYRELLMQGSNGTFYLMMSNEQPLNTTGTDGEINVSPVSVTIQFNENVMTNVSVIDLIKNTTVNNPYVSRVTFQLPAYPIILAITHP